MSTLGGVQISPETWLPIGFALTDGRAYNIWCQKFGRQYEGYWLRGRGWCYTNHVGAAKPIRKPAFFRELCPPPDVMSMVETIELAKRHGV